MSESTKVTALRLENIFSYQRVEINGLGDIVGFVGEEGEGKTSLLQAIRAVLGDRIPADIIRRGEQVGTIVIDLEKAGELMTVRRSFERDGIATGEVQVTKDGLIQPRAKTFVQGMVNGTLGFNPIAWVRMSDDGKAEDLRRQKQVMLEALPMTLTPAMVTAAGITSKVSVPAGQHGLVVQQSILETLAASQKENNAAVKSLESTVNELGDEPPKPDVASSVKAANEAEENLDQVRQAANAWKNWTERESERRRKGDDLIAQLTDAKRRRDEHPKPPVIVDMEADLQAIDERIADMERQLDKFRANSKTLAEAIASAKLTAQAVATLEAEVARVEKELTAASSEIPKPEKGLKTQENIADAIKVRDFARKDLEKARIAKSAYDTWHAADSKREDLERRKVLAVQLTKDIAAARNVLPKLLLGSVEGGGIEGLSLDGDRLLLNGVGIESCAENERLRLAFRIAAMVGRTKGLPFIMLDGAESLGKRSRVEVGRLMADLPGFQFFFTTLPLSAMAEMATHKVEGGSVEPLDK